MYLKYLLGILFHELKYTILSQMTFMLGVTENGGCVGPHDFPLLIDLGL